MSALVSTCPAPRGRGVLAAFTATLLLLVGPLAVTGCGDTVPQNTFPDEPEPSSAAGEPDGAEPDGATSPDSPAEPAPLAEPPGRLVHRLSVEQLARSIPVITGGIEWTEDFGEGEQDMLQVLAGTLGAPDYVLVVQESLEPSLIIAKFMQDASLRVCAKWLKSDRDLPPDERTLIVHTDWSSLDEADVKQSLRALQLRFFSRYVPEDDEPGGADADPAVDALYELFVAASSAAPPSKAADDGWLAVCLAHMTDPNFVLY